jgi:hypothetical protein
MDTNLAALIAQGGVDGTYTEASQENLTLIGTRAINGAGGILSITSLQVTMPPKSSMAEAGSRAQSRLPVLSFLQSTASDKESMELIIRIERRSIHVGGGLREADQLTTELTRKTSAPRSQSNFLA